MKSTVAALLALALAAADPAAADPCRVVKDVDINPHTAGIGWARGDNVNKCCALCRSPAWWSKGCRFSTLSKGRCWMKADNRSVVHSPGHDSVACLSPAPSPPPPPPPPPTGTTGPWIKIGPYNIGDDIHQNGEAGTMADAVSPPNNPLLMFAGGQNNGASSGVVKSVDGGKHWTVASAGIFTTKIEGLHIVDYDGESKHILCAVPGGIYESFDQAASWTLLPGSKAFGTCNTFKNGTINGVAHVLAGCSAGIANVPKAGGTWQVIPPGGMQRGYFSVSDSNLRNSIVGSCVAGTPWIGNILNRTAANWTHFPGRACTMLALDPNNGSKFIYTQPPLIWRCVLSPNLTKSCVNLGGNGGSFHAGMPATEEKRVAALWYHLGKDALRPQPGTISVAASDDDDVLASYSNHGKCTTIIAPGSSIVAAWTSGTTDATSMSGTSMATPHAAGAVLQVLGKFPHLKPEEVRRALACMAQNNIVHGNGMMEEYGGTPNRLLRGGVTLDSEQSLKMIQAQQMGDEFVSAASLTHDVRCHKTDEEEEDTVHKADDDSDSVHVQGARDGVLQPSELDISAVRMAKARARAMAKAKATR